jgi:hypothetical protein
LLEFENILSFYCFQVIPYLSIDLQLKLIPKIALKLSSKDSDAEKYVGIAIFASIPFHENFNLQAFIDGKIIELLIPILKYKDFKPMPFYNHSFLLKHFPIFMDHIINTYDGKLVKIILDEAVKNLNSTDFEDISVCFSIIFSIFDRVPLMTNWKDLLPLSDFFNVLKQMLEQENGEILPVLYNIITGLVFFDKDPSLLNLKEIGPIINLLVKQIGNFENQASIDSSWALSVLCAIMKNDIYPWIDSIFKKCISVLNKNKKNNFQNLGMVLVTIAHFVTNYRKETEKFVDSPGFYDLILHYSLVILPFFEFLETKRFERCSVGILH